MEANDHTIDKSKETVAVLIHIQKDIYDEYLNTLGPRSLKRQSYNARLFTNSIKTEINNYNGAKLL
jgi:hypothetical protein